MQLFSYKLRVEDNKKGGKTNKIIGPFFNANSSKNNEE